MTAPSLIARQLRTAGRAFRSWLKVWASSPLLHACRLSTGAATAGIASMVVIGTTGAMLGVSPSLAQEKHRADFVTGSVDDSVLTQASTPAPQRLRYAPQPDRTQRRDPLLPARTP